jgi:hypothetical protein
MKRALAVSFLALTVLSCRHAAEHTLLAQFFAASRLRDLTALSRYGSVVFEPTRDGIVTRFEILQVMERGTGAEVWITAPVRLPDGRTMAKNYAVTIQGGLVTAISERPAPGRAEGPASPSTQRP